MTSSGVSIKEEMEEEIESSLITDCGVFVKTEPSITTNSDVIIKEEMVCETEPTVITSDIKEEESPQIYYGDVIHVKEEKEMLVPDEEAKQIKEFIKKEGELRVMRAMNQIQRDKELHALRVKEASLKCNSLEKELDAIRLRKEVLMEELKVLSSKEEFLIKDINK